MRIKFIVSPIDHIIRGRILNPVYWMLRTYYKFASKNYDKITWINAHFDIIKDCNTIVQKIIDEEVDILCLSIYIWNRNQYLDIAKKVKEINPNIIIIAGGPELDAHKNKNFWESHKQLDYVVYGDGELAFKILLDHIVASAPLDNAVNIVTREKIYPFKVFVDQEYSSISPWLEMKEDVIKVVSEAKNETLLLNWEMSRGCPYECSFCDWTGGLHNKVKRRRSNWREEIDFFNELGVNVSIIDANWGIFKEDLEIHKYACEKLGNKWFTNSFSKLNKTTVYEMIKIRAKSSNEPLRADISIQDINPTVLKNIDRPEIPWVEHKKLLLDLIKEVPNVTIGPELVCGLPGQTIDTFFDTIIELTSFKKIKIGVHGFIILTNSPAFSLDYRQKFNIKTDDFIWMRPYSLFQNKNQVIESFVNQDSKTYKADTVISTYSCNFSDILAMHNFANFYNTLIDKSNILDPIKILKMSKNKIIDVSAKDAELIQEYKIFGVKTERGFADYRDRWKGNNITNIFKDN